MLFMRCFKTINLNPQQRFKIPYFSFPGGGGGGTPLQKLKGMCGAKEYGFRDVLV